MRCYQSTFIAIYFLIGLLWTTLLINATKDENKKIIFELHIFQQNNLHLPVHIISSPFQSCRNKILSTIFNEFLTIHEILTLRKTCKDFQMILFPNDKNMVIFCTDFGSEEIDNVSLMWIDLKYFLNESYTNALKKIEMWNIKQNQYVVFTRDEKIISWYNEQAFDLYPKLIFNNIKNQIDHPFHIIENTFFLEKKSLEYESPRIYSKGCRNAWAKITNEGNVITNGPIRYGGDSSHVQSQLKNVKMIVSSRYAFVALLSDSSIVTWGGQYDTRKIHEQIQTRLYNVKMIFSNSFAFAALLGNGRVISWGEEYYGGNILNQFKPNYTNVKMIFSTKKAFVALLDGGSVVAWGDEAYGGKIPESIQIYLHQNVKMIFSTDYAFAALLHDGGRVVVWGNEAYGGRIPAESIRNVKMIFSSSRAFAVLFYSGYAFAWGIGYNGDAIAYGIQTHFYHNVKMIFSNDEAFVALLNNGNFVGWGSRRYGGEITHEVQTYLKNVKVIFSCRVAFAALLNDGSVFTWGKSIPLEVQSELMKNVKMIFPETNGFTALCNNGKIISWRNW